MSTHPLHPLSGDELQRALACVLANEPARAQLRDFRLVQALLEEADPRAVAAFDAARGERPARLLLLVFLETENGYCFEALVDVGYAASSSSVASTMLLRFEHIVGAHPALTPDEYELCERVVKADPLFREAMARRGITDMALIMVDLWAAGAGYVTEAAEPRRICKPLVFVRPSHAPHQNGYAHPVDGLEVVVDLQRGVVTSVSDAGAAAAPLPEVAFPWQPEQFRADPPKPYLINQPEGESFTLRDKNLVSWQGWQFRVGFNCREGLTLHGVTFQQRQVLHRSSLSEMIVPYAHPALPYCRKNAFDVGEEGLGFNANSLRGGCDCLGISRFLSAVLHDSKGAPAVLENAVCIHEVDAGLLYRHTDWRTKTSYSARDRRLVVSFFATVANYDYGFFYYFKLDGSIEFECRLTGALNVHAIAPTVASSPYGTIIAPGLLAPLHAHYFCLRLHWAVDGDECSLHEMNAVRVPRNAESNPQGNAVMVELTPLRSESEAQRDMDFVSCRSWRVCSASAVNRMGAPTAYVINLKSVSMASSLAHRDSSVMTRAAFLSRQLWATPYHPREKYPAGDYPNQRAGTDGLPKWTRADRSLAPASLVTWVNVGSLHFPRPEEFPIMPVTLASLHLNPCGFFPQNPALDLPVQRCRKTNAAL